MTTVFNERFRFAVVRAHFSKRGYIVCETVVAACVDRAAAIEVYRQLRLDNPDESFSFHQVC